MDKKPNYLKILLEEYFKNPDTFQKGKVTQVHVYHDSWCEIHQGKPCNCDPDVIIAKPDEPKA